MAQSRASSQLDVRTFDQLVRGVEETLLEGKRRIEQATIFGNWETGRLINEHTLLNQHRADYAGQVISRLARRIAINARVLYHCAQFHRRFPILNTCSKLSWSHFRVLCQLDDESRRKQLLNAAQKNDWTVAELEDRIRQLNLAAAEDDTGPNGSNGSATAAKPRLLTGKQGTPGLYPVAARRDGLALDLGFKIYLPLAADETRRLKLAAGSIVRVDANRALAPEDASTWLEADDATKADLFTYRARDVRVVDGDTLAVTIALPPHREIDKKLRLRGINCPEMNCTEGKAAKRFARELVDGATSVMLTTTKPDKYDRYLADVFLELRSGEAVFLNNALLENGHAVRSDGSAPADWIA